jgi:hypothetical protein
MTEFVHDLTVGLLIALVFYPLLGILALRFRIENGAIKVINFGIISYEVRHIVINQIREIKLVPTWKIFPLIFIPILCFGCRWWNKNVILIRMNTGLLKLTLLTPADPEGFFEKVKEEFKQ